MRIQERLSLLLVLVALAVPAQASNWYPIESGLAWVYSDTEGELHTGIIGAPISFHGATVQPLEWNSGSIEYFSDGGSGRVLQHGVTYPDGNSIEFDPPILRMDSELTLGHAWESNTTAIYYGPDGVETARGWSRSAFEVLDVRSMEVAAGTFLVAEVYRTEAREDTEVPSKREILYNFREYYADGVGWVLRTDHSGTRKLFELEAYGPGGVSNDTSSWGALKAIYEN